MKKKVLSVIGFITGSIKIAAQTANTSLESVNAELRNQYQKILDLAGTILLILLVLAFIFMIINFIFNVTENKKSITTFLVTLLLYGLFKVIF